jgi:uncharacterized protein YkwD
MRKALVIILLALGLGVPTLTCALLPVAAEAATTPTQSERLVIAAVNHERSLRGLARVCFQASLTRAARSHASELAQRGLLSHVSANGWTVSPRVRHFGYTTDGCTRWTAGETLASASLGSVAATPQAIVMLWMTSPTHRAVLLTARLRDVGVGIAVGNDGRRYFTVDLGRRVKG